MIAIIPAKGNSSRIPRKNLRSFHGRSIIAYSIATASESGLFSRIIVSTEDNEIASVSQGYGAEVFRRKAEFCEDRYGPVDVARNVIEILPTDARFVCVILATAPLMRTEDLRLGLDVLKGSGMDYALSVYGADDRPITDAAQFIWATRSALRLKVPLAGSRTVLVPIPPSRVCDINTLEDWARAERMYAELCGEMICGDVFKSVCEHDYALRTDVPHPDMIHLRCTKCGEALPT